MLLRQLTTRRYQNDSSSIYAKCMVTLLFLVFQNDRDSLFEEYIYIMFLSIICVFNNSITYYGRLKHSIMIHLINFVVL